MNLKQLEAYLWVAKLGSFSKTAERLYTTQPAISSRISNLEDELRATLFDRDAGAVRLTATGRALMPLAEKVLDAVEAMREGAGNTIEATGLLRLGVSETIVQTWLPELLARLRETYPALDVEMSVDVTSNLRKELIEHALDLAFLLGPVSEYTVTNVPLCEYPMIWAMRPTDEFKKKTSMTMSEMLRFPILTYARNTRPFIEIHEAFRAATGVTPRLFPSTSLSACQRMAEHGVGIGSMPKLLAANALREGRLIEIDMDWHPTPLKFTATYIADPSRPVIARIAEMARDVAQSA